eukprot:gene8312-15996_t
MIGGTRRQRSARTTFEGVEGGIDREATLALWKSQELTRWGKGGLKQILAGALYTRERLKQQRSVDSEVCPYCDTGETEDLLHIWWHCPAWDGVRARHPRIARADRREWPLCTQTAGLLPETFPGRGTVWDAARRPPRDARREELVPADPALLSRVLAYAGEVAARRAELGAKRLHDLWPDGEAWVGGKVVVYTDGAALQQQYPQLRRAGCGAFWGPRHPRNLAEPLPREGHTGNTSKVGELTAVLRVLEREPRPAQVRTNSRYVWEGVHEHMAEWRRWAFRRGPGA